MARPDRKPPEPIPGRPLKNEHFDLEFAEGGVVRMRRVGDPFETDFAGVGHVVCQAVLTWRPEGESAWREADLSELLGAPETSVAKEADSSGDTVEIVETRPKHPVEDVFDEAAGTYEGRWTLVEEESGAPAVQVRTRFALEGAVLCWTLEVENVSDAALEIGDLAPTLPMNTAHGWNSDPSKFVQRHGLISSHGSFLYWLRGNAQGPHLTALPAPGSKFECFWTKPVRGLAEGSFRPYFHSATLGEIAREKGCNWRQPQTGLTLAPGEKKACGLDFTWEAGYGAIRDRIVAGGGIDVQVVPGMVVPTDLEATFSLRTRQTITAVEPEHPEETDVAYLGERADGVHLYRARFRRLGENTLTVRYGEGRSLVLEFFACQPVETLVKKRGAFIADKQHRDETLWYDGLLAEWNNETGVMLGPDNYDRIKGWRIYEVTCDDPGLSKPAFLAAKNAEHPEPKEIEALDYYIENFVWGGLQRTDEETYAFGIYGIPDWKKNRESDDDGPKGKLHIWRCYDYPHVMLMYLKMYQIAKRFPHVKTRLSKEEYLRRAAGTAEAMFTIPLEVGKWSALKTGFYNELELVHLIEELEEAGRQEEADAIRGHWEDKIRAFITDNPSLFGSEYPFDSTGFESTHALARYAQNEMPRRGDKLGVSPEAVEQFMQLQMDENLFCRGWLDTAYYWLGSDYRAGGPNFYTLTYMAQMGGWGVLDYALYVADDPFELLRLGCNSSLSSWALMNAGTPESNYGYWFPGLEHDGAAGGGFEPLPYGHTWLEQPHHRGSWYYSCEIDLGFCAGLRCARTVFAEDPLFGPVAYAGALGEEDGAWTIVPRDGVRRRFHAVSEKGRLHMIVERDLYAAETPIRLAKDFSRVDFTLENQGGPEHRTRLKLEGLAEGEWTLEADGAAGTSFTAKPGERAVLEIPVPEGTKTVAVTLRKA